MAFQHGLRSRRLLDHPDIAAWHRAQCEAITVDLGGESELTALAQAEQREVIAFLREENRVLKAQLGGRGSAWMMISGDALRSWGNASDGRCCTRWRRW